MRKLKRPSKSSVVSSRKRLRKVTEEPHKYNPFEVQVSRRKYDVLGRWVERGERGLPGLSRSRAIEKVIYLIQRFYFVIYIIFRERERY